MSPRGRTRCRSAKDQSYQRYLLTSRVSKSQHWDDEFDEDINPDSDAAFLRRHRSIDRDNSDTGQQVAKPGLLQRVFTLMSQLPLLRGFSSTKDAASYGALPNQGSRSQSADWDLADDLPLAATSEDEDEGDQVVSIDDDEDVLDPPDNSPYPQVRASVVASDDISASINTPRMWILSFLCALLGSATNLFFSLRYPSVAITPVIALVIVHPLGRAWDRLLKSPDDPVETFEYGNRVRAVKVRDPVLYRSRMLRLRRWLAQGHWNGKEHACVSRSQEHASLLLPELGPEIIFGEQHSSFCWSGLFHDSILALKKLR